MSTGTELVTLQEKYPILRMTPEDVREAFEANAGAPGKHKNIESYLTRISAPKQGVVHWTVPDVDGSDGVVPELRGIIVYRGFRGLVWPRKECDKGTLPILRTDDLVTAYEVGEEWGDVDQDDVRSFRRDDGTYDWSDIAGEGGPCGWPDKDDKDAKRTRMAKELRVLCFLAEGQTAPWLIFVPSTSVTNIDNAIIKMTLSGTPYYGAEVRLFAKKEKSRSGYDISRLDIVKTGSVPKELRDIIKKTFTDTLAATIRHVEAEAAEGDDLA